MEHVLVGQDRVTSDAVQKCLQHALASSNHPDVLLGFCVLGSIVSDGLLGRDWGDDESWIQLHEAQA
jgi:hypothetical protein